MRQIEITIITTTWSSVLFFLTLSVPTIVVVGQCYPLVKSFVFFLQKATDTITTLCLLLLLFYIHFICAKWWFYCLRRHAEVQLLHNACHADVLHAQLWNATICPPLPSCVCAYCQSLRLSYASCTSYAQVRLCVCMCACRDVFVRLVPLSIDG